MIEFRDIHKRFGEHLVLRGVSATVRRGEVLYVIGASGAGKSVLVKHVVGFVRPDSGSVWLDGQDVTHLPERALTPVRKRCALVFQHPTLFDSMTLLDNVALPLRKHRGLATKEARGLARALLARVRLESFADRMPAEVGEGLRKRGAIARALALDPEYVVFDEPTTGLDPAAAAHVDGLVRTLADDLGVTCLVVSHDLRSIFTVADRIVMLYRGAVRLDGTPDEYRQTGDPVVRQFVEGRPDGPLDESVGDEE